jgi:hypothetical protein
MGTVTYDTRLRFQAGRKLAAQHANSHPNAEYVPPHKRAGEPPSSLVLTRPLANSLVERV